MNAPGPDSVLLVEDYFSLFGLPCAFELDTQALDQAHRALQTRVHPDRHTGGSDVERRRAEQASAQAHQAYRCLKDPVARGRYLLMTQRGVDTCEESFTAMPPSFLIEQMGWREELEAALNDAGALQHLLDAARCQRTALIDGFARAYTAHDDEAAAMTIRKLRFVDKFIRDVDDALVDVA
jgi:molecular chaperone HscB